VATTANGAVELWWDAAGEGAPVVLIPGRGDSSDIYPERFRDRLVEGGREVIVFDARETGLSGGADDSTLGDMADDVVAVLDAAGADRAHVVALSMGGFLTVDLAVRHGGRLASITFLSAISPDPDAGFGPAFFEGDPDPVEGRLAAMGVTDAADRVWVEAEVATAETRAPARPDAGDRHMEAVFRSGFPTLDQLEAITVRVLIIHGVLDQTLPVAHAEAFARELPDARLVVLDGMGHLPKPGEWDVIAELVLAHTE